jgi:hypothetical protein
MAAISGEYSSCRIQRAFDGGDQRLVRRFHAPHFASLSTTG